MSVAENIAQVRACIEESAKKSGRRAEDIRLVAVSKTVDLGRIREALGTGIADLGENRVQEMMEKMPELPENVRWHMIGRLQKNKVKYIIGKTELIHSLCSLEVAAEIERLSAKHGVQTDCLVQINIGREESKAGIAEEELPAFLEALAPMKHIRVRGLMAIAPIVEHPEAARPYFARMKELFDGLPETERVRRDWLSMGMSGDFEVAIEEGANLVRVGSSIFGRRNY